MSIQTETATVQSMIQLLDEAVEQQTTAGCCEAVKRVLEEIVASGKEFVSEEFLHPASDRYARRLLHRDPAGRYTVLVLVWGVGQGTSLHDHAGMWCVECVYRGSILVKSYSLDDEVGNRFRFTKERELVAGIGHAGTLIPPFDYHTIANADSDRSAVTLHVYGGEMTSCNAFLPEGDLYRMETRELHYTD
jgi:predicted metal-dependent enzyme (double-stranded beta helix superfamily)